MTTKRKPKRTIEVTVKVDGQLFQTMQIEGNNYMHGHSEFFRDTPEIGAEVCKKLKLAFKDQEADYREKVEDMERHQYYSRMAKN